MPEYCVLVILFNLVFLLLFGENLLQLVHGVDLLLVLGLLLAHLVLHLQEFSLQV